ncbi:NADH dehydrogenase subunit L [Desulfobulbus propionicus DSM 2032]|uniref:NADH dehydrogenase subunit L n=1 Tax=Desulfobulbus propionicus (strain ATCC 33891 / DSM 2032 / VKM B-1956 / 1pr3) TaxID=577650 RepID=A0A7U3YMA1_DESPD|nr:NADH-quinone oxidoreductase subunit L [Desulfobulbus propionicus]ADW18017.1 NADH dehydrogenase subunit L [Desulfobulbus propionicus DSM 2032]
MPASLLAIPLLPLASFVLTLLLGKRWGTRAHWLPIITVLLSFGCALATLFRVQSGTIINQDLYTWIESGTLRVSVGFLVDQLTAVMLIVVTSISSLVHIYSVGYMKGEEGYYRFFAYLSLFTFSMLMLVLGNNFLQLFFGWEAVGLSSYLLIGFYYEKQSASDAGKKAFIVNRFGDFGFILGLFLIFTQFGSLHYQEVFSRVGSLDGQTLSLFGTPVSVATLIALLLFCGAIGKSAQMPLHVWLPDAMEGPTPVSALIHAATMVTAGVFLVARCNPIFELSHFTLNLITVLGAITALFAATIALVQTDIKRVVAYSTVSQLAYMFIGCGVGAYSAGIFHLFTHAYFKALLFLGCGSVILGMHHQQDVRSMGGLKQYMPITYWTFLLASLSISGVPGLAGFFSKDEILLMAFNTPLAAGKFAWAIGTLVAFMTAFYSFRLFFLIFHGEFRGTDHQRDHLHESPLVVTLPLMLLACGAVAAGWFGVPAILGGDNHWAHFLEPVLGHPPIHVSGTVEALLMGSSILAGVCGIGLAFYLYRLKPQLPTLLAERLSFVYRLLLNKYYIDELYIGAIVKPTLAFSHGVLLRLVDLACIEGVVNGLPRAIGAFSQRLRRIQDGQVSHYLAWMGGGALALVVVLLIGR